MYLIGLIRPYQWNSLLIFALNGLRLMLQLSDREILSYLNLGWFELRNFLHKLEHCTMFRKTDFLESRLLGIWCRADDD